MRARVQAGVKAAGPRACFIVDIDNVLGDTRYRTRAAAEAYACKRPQAHALAELRIGQIGWNGRLTASRAGLASAAAEDFHRFWETFFWKGSNFRYDRAMHGSIDLVWAAQQSGAEIFYLTGRVQTLKRSTLRELARFGLPGVDAKHVLCKPSVEDDTIVFKRGRLEKLAASGRRLAWYLGDSTAELRAFSDLVSCLAVDFPVRSPKDPSLPAGIPRLRYGRRSR